MWSALALVVGLAITAGQPSEVISAIQIHGNTATPDDEVRTLAGVRVSAPVTATTIDEVLTRLRAAKRFQHVDVLKRFASISDPSQIVLVIVVDEGPVKIEMTGDADRPTRVVRTHRLNVLFLPILDAEDGYGLAYGGRFALPDAVGKGGRVSFPITWGGRKQAAIELDKAIMRGPIDRVLAGASVTRRTNPFFDQDDDRRRAWVRAEKELVPHLRVGAIAGVQSVSFGGQDERFTHAGADVVLDTRLDPFLARNAVYARASWEHVSFAGDPVSHGPQAGRYVGTANRTELDARGYVGVFRQNIVAVRVLRHDSDRPLPLYLQPLLGGMANLRGFRAGSAAGDTLFATSAELIVPLTTPLSIGKIGVSAFVDEGTVYSKGQRLADQTLERGVGGSLWFTAAFLRLNIAVAHGLGATTRMHIGGSVTF